MLELCTFAIHRNLSSAIACLGCKADKAVDAPLYSVLLASYSRTAWIEHLELLGEPSSQKHGTSRNLYPVV
jgi:hypothetical protein